VEEKLLKGSDVAEKLHVSLSFAYSLMRRGDIPTVRMGRLLRVHPEDLERYIREREMKYPKAMKEDQ
jgi:excisionase family DNA binding protein